MLDVGLSGTYSHNYLELFNLKLCVSTFSDFWYFFVTTSTDVHSTDTITVLQWFLISFLLNMCGWFRTYNSVNV